MTYIKSLAPQHVPTGATADDLECLWAIARRSNHQDLWVEMCGRRLEQMGLIQRDYGWPCLTPAGIELLQRATHRLWEQMQNNSTVSDSAVIVAAKRRRHYSLRERLLEKRPLQLATASAS